MATKLPEIVGIFFKALESRDTARICFCFLSDVFVVFSLCKKVSILLREKEAIPLGAYGSELTVYFLCADRENNGRHRSFTRVRNRK